MELDEDAGLTNISTLLVMEDERTLVVGDAHGLHAFDIESTTRSEPCHS